MYVYNYALRDRGENDMMKKRRSIFVKIGLLIIPLILLVDALVLLLSYNITYNNNLKSCERRIRNAAEAAAEYSEELDLSHNDMGTYAGEFYTRLCKTYDITYIFAESIDLENNSETYLAIGFGENASKDAQKTRYPGVVVDEGLYEAQIEAYNGDKDGVIYHYANQFDDTIVCYMPCTRYLDTNTLDYVDLKENYIIGAEISLNTVLSNFRHSYRIIALLTVVLTLLIVVVFAIILYVRVSKPLRKISRKMVGFVADREQHTEKLEVRGNDELAEMAQSFNTMADEIDSYISHIDELTREKHTREAELNIARKIQIGLLRPEKMDGTQFGVDAYMLPAKDVGGDLYDYSVQNDGRIFVVVADVSGKGVSGALFMAHAITLLRQYMTMGYSPAQILENYNRALASQNPGRMFITTFLGEYDPESGRLTYANAGHNMPYVLSDKLIALDQAHGVAAGLFPQATYEDAAITLRAGDTLFINTDGVDEARDEEGSFYTTKRLKAVLTGCLNSDSAAVLHDVLNDLNRFREGAEQYDDITIMTLHIKDTEKGN